MDKFSEKTGVQGKWTIEVHDALTGELVRRQVKTNLIPTVGLAAMAAQFAATHSKEVGDNLYIAVGSDGTAPNLADTQLGTEVARKAVGSNSSAGAIATIAVFFAAGEATGTHAEAGLFGDGNTTEATAVADSGILYSHVLFSETVGASQTLTLTFELTYS
jgi:hypothetical protein